MLYFCYKVIRGIGKALWPTLTTLIHREAHRCLGAFQGCTRSEDQEHPSLKIQDRELRFLRITTRSAANTTVRVTSIWHTSSRDSLTRRGYSFSEPSCWRSTTFDDGGGSTTELVYSAARRGDRGDREDNRRTRKHLRSVGVYGVRTTGANRADRRKHRVRDFWSSAHRNHLTNPGFTEMLWTTSKAHKGNC